MATGAVVTSTYKTVKAILEANERTWRDLADRHADFEFAEMRKLRSRIKELEDQVFHFTGSGFDAASITPVSEHGDKSALASAEPSSSSGEVEP